MNLDQLPKIELHVHHEGAARPEFIRQLAFEKNVDLSHIFDDQGGYIYRDFNHFLQVYEAACTVLQTPQDFYRLTLDILEHSAQQGVIYTETFISPDFCGGGDVAAWIDYVSAIEEAAHKAHRQFGIQMRGIATCIRHFGPDQAKLAAHCAAESSGQFITGFGMGGDEKMGRQGDFAYSFDMAREANLKLTTHAGEWGGAESVRQAIMDLNVDRLGHGIQVVEDNALVDEVIARQVTLEVCPGSNVFLGAAKDLQTHPIHALKDKGVRVTVSTDDPPFFHTTLIQEYRNLVQECGWQGTDLKQVNLDAAQAAFCDDETRSALLKKIEDTEWTL